jgi:hypothetical protein
MSPSRVRSQPPLKSARGSWMMHVQPQDALVYDQLARSPLESLVGQPTISAVFCDLVTNVCWPYRETVMV